MVLTTFTPNYGPVAKISAKPILPIKQEGEREADFINCVIWWKAVETLSKYARKGSLIGVIWAYPNTKLRQRPKTTGLCNRSGD